MKNMSVIFVLFGVIILCVSGMKPTVNWYTNTNLDNNKRIYKVNPSVFDGFYFCCGEYEFTGNGKFTFKNSSGLVPNIDHFRSKVSSIYIHGGILSDEIFSIDFDDLKPAFKQAAELAQQLNIDGYLVDYEPHSDSKDLAKNYTNFLHEFGTILHKYDVKIGCDIAGWGILKYFDLYAKSELDFYTSMTPTYNGNNLTYNEEYVHNELQYIKPDNLRTGIGSMLTTYPANHTWYFNWTKSELNTFLNFLKDDVKVPSVDIWRADMDNNGYDTESWFYNDLNSFVNN